MLNLIFSSPLELVLSYDGQNEWERATEKECTRYESLRTLKFEPVCVEEGKNKKARLSTSLNGEAEGT